MTVEAFQKMEQEIMDFINNLDPKVAYQAHIDQAIEAEDYEQASMLVTKMEAECGKA